MKTNTLRSEPAKKVGGTTITHDGRQITKPSHQMPQFEEALQTSHNRLFGMAIMRVR